MVKKNQSTGEKSATKSRVNVSKLQLKRETIRDLSIREKKEINGGVRPGANTTGSGGDTERPTCSCFTCG